MSARRQFDGHFGVKMTDNRDVWFLIEQEEGKIADVSLELSQKVRTGRATSAAESVG